LSPHRYAQCGLPPHELSREEGAPKNTREAREGMSPAVRAKLEAFYAPFNERLFALLGRRLDSNW
jgi:hypothetical protein